MRIPLRVLFLYDIINVTSKATSGDPYTYPNDSGMYFMLSLVRMNNVAGERQDLLGFQRGFTIVRAKHAAWETECGKLIELMAQVVEFRAKSRIK
jgi:hypothetical protein